MSFNWNDYLTLAEWLYKNPSLSGVEEAGYRAAISRAYYAAFQRALEFAEDEGYIRKYSGDDHTGVSKFFNRKGDKERNTVYTNLERMRLNRRKADYDLDLKSTPLQLTLYTIQMAQKVLNILDNLQE